MSTCPHCGAQLPPVQDAFCSSCHEPLDESPAELPEPVEQASWRRLYRFMIGERFSMARYARRLGFLCLALGVLRIVSSLGLARESPLEGVLLLIVGLAFYVGGEVLRWAEAARR